MRTQTLIFSLLCPNAPSTRSHTDIQIFYKPNIYNVLSTWRKYYLFQTRFLYQNRLPKYKINQLKAL